MYISRLDISGLRGFVGPRSVHLDFARPDGTYSGWTVLAGRNGSGKTSILQAIALSIMGGMGNINSEEIEEWGRYSSNGTADVAVNVVQIPEPFTRQFNNFTYSATWGNLNFHGAPGADPSLPRAIFGEVPKVLPACGYGPRRRLTSPRLRHHIPAFDSFRTLFDDEVGLTEGVSWLIQQHLYRLEKRPGAAELLKHVVGLIGDGLLPEDYTIEDVDSDGLWVRRRSDRVILRHMSDGYQTTVALVLDIVRQMSGAYGELDFGLHDAVPVILNPGLVLIDEVDVHLHISWQMRIGDWLKSHFPNVQFIVSTHSPFICQSADPGGLIRLPGPEENVGPHQVDQDLYERIVFGSADDAILTDLFGMDSPYSAQAEKMRGRLEYLERRVLNGEATGEEKNEYRELTRSLTSSPSARVDEIASRLGLEP
ncbi:AAA family ATPase [Herbidospora sp. NEAU-GS84]|uniref:AAA family ATPase n=2 Tax=Herbidospora solisilvae TaxID=2696284 RepID=A0A7C9JS02_9ACTN|nr:AAA family ATPase [Herbidospora solisilvae]